LLHLRPDLLLLEIRGNVDTRLRKLDSGEYDAIVLAVAGLSRLGWADRISQRLSPPRMYYAVGQGALGIECRTDDAATIAALAPLDDAATRRHVTAERALLATFRAGCHAPVGVAASSSETVIRLEGVVLNLSGTERIQAVADHADPHRVANLVAGQLLAAGADRLMGRASGG
jgi:hydroxymethylbilane synthase